MPVDPIKLTLKAPGMKHLKLQYNQLLSSFTFKSNLRRYTKRCLAATFMKQALTGVAWDLRGRGLHSSTILLNVSTFCGIRWAHDFPPVY